MNERTIKLLQKRFGYNVYQDLINSGEAWKIGGLITKKCKKALEKGACFLPHNSIHVNILLTIPSRYEIEKGGVGSIERSKEYWKDSWNVSTEIGKRVMKTKRESINIL